MHDVLGGLAVARHRHVEFRRVDLPGEAATVLRPAALLLQYAVRDERRPKAVYLRFAFYYNGSQYKKNSYDTNLKAFYETYTKKGVPDLGVRASQARLLYLGFDPNGIDGFFGTKTSAAVRAFQVATNLETTATSTIRPRRY